MNNIIWYLFLGVIIIGCIVWLYRFLSELFVGGKKVAIAYKEGKIPSCFVVVIIVVIIIIILSFFISLIISF